MPLESATVFREEWGSLQGCLVGGDLAQRRRERGIRRRALVLSVALQGTILAALVLVPLFGKQYRIALANMTPIPPYYPLGAGARRSAATQPPRGVRNKCRFCAPTRIPPTIVTHDSGERSPDTNGPPTFEGGPQIIGEIPLNDARTAVRPPAPTETHAPKQRIHTQLDTAMLIRRVEPIYPTLAKQLGRLGRVELRAIIATDGTIQSLQVVGGDPLFYQSALEAVQQWRYRPTVLNGQPVEIDTYITVIYHLEH